MKRMLTSAALASAICAMPGFALADEMKGHDAMATPAAMMICRPATAKETPTAMTTATKIALVCKNIPAAMMQKGPDLSGALSADQVDAAWRKWVQSMIVVSGDGGG